MIGINVWIRGEQTRRHALQADPHTYILYAETLAHPQYCSPPPHIHIYIYIICRERGLSGVKHTKKQKQTNGTETLSRAPPVLLPQPRVERLAGPDEGAGEKEDGALRIVVNVAVIIMWVGVLDCGKGFGV